MAKHYTIAVQKNARVHLDALFKSGDKASIKRINQIFVDLSEHPETGAGQPEKLKFDLSGFWSRKSTKKIGWFILLKTK